MAEFTSCYELTEKGIAIFKDVFFNKCSESKIDQCDPSVVRPVKSTKRLLVCDCKTAKEMASVVVKALGRNEVR